MKHNFRIGARIHDLVKDVGGDLTQALKESGAETAQLTLYKFAVGGEPKEGFSDGYLSRIKDAFAAADIKIAALSCYINPICAEAEKEIAAFCRYVDYAEKLGVKIVATETGSVVENIKDYRRNHEDGVFGKLICNMRPATEYARRKRCKIGIESVAYFPVCSADTFDGFCKAFPKSDIAAVFDPTNLLSAENCENQRAVFEEFLKRHFEKIEIVHLKDFVIGKHGITEEMPLFNGRLDVRAVIELLIKYGVKADIIVEAAESVENYKRITEKLQKITEEI